MVHGLMFYSCLWALEFPQIANFLPNSRLSQLVWSLLLAISSVTTTKVSSLVSGLQFSLYEGCSYDPGWLPVSPASGTVLSAGRKWWCVAAIALFTIFCATQFLKNKLSIFIQRNPSLLCMKSSWKDFAAVVVLYDCIIVWVCVCVLYVIVLCVQLQKP